MTVEEGASGLRVAQQAAHEERVLRLATFESLDAKAGLIGGAALALTALGAATGWAPLVLVGVLPAAGAVAFAFRALQFRGVTYFEPDTLGEIAAFSEEAALRRVMSLENKWAAQLRDFNTKKVEALKWARWLLLTTAVVFFHAVLVKPVREVIEMLGR